MVENKSFPSGKKFLPAGYAVCRWPAGHVQTQIFLRTVTTTTHTRLAVQDTQQAKHAPWHSAARLSPRWWVKPVEAIRVVRRWARYGLVGRLS